MDDLGGDPPEVDQGLHWHNREPCPFTREEGEAHGTYAASGMSRNEGEDMLATGPIDPGTFGSAT